MTLKDDAGSGVAVLATPTFFSDNPPLLWNRGAIAGAGRIEPSAPFMNDGVIDANVPGRELAIDFNFIRSSSGFGFSVVNGSGLLRASQGGVLRIVGTTTFPSLTLGDVSGSDAGRIEAGPGSEVQLNQVWVAGETLAALDAVDATPAGRIVVDRGALESVAIEGEVLLKNSLLSGAIQNTGAVTMTGTSQPQSTLELAGGGLVRLGDPSPENSSSVIVELRSFTPTPPQIINHDNTLRGLGEVRTTAGQFINYGLIEAGHDPEETPDKGELRFNALVTNAGVMRATNGNELTLGVVANSIGTAPGVIEAAPGGVLQVASVTGGVLRSLPDDGGGTGGRVVFSRPNITNPVSLADVRIEGAIGNPADMIALSGDIELVGSLHASDLRIYEEARLTGGGQLIIEDFLGASTASEQRGAVQRLVNSDGTIVMRNAFIESSSSYLLELVNHSDIVNEGNSNSGGSFPTVQIINSGRITAAAGTTFTLATQITNQSNAGEGVLHAEAGAVLSVTSVTGGVLTTAPAAEGEPAGEIRIQSLFDVENRGRVVISSNSGLIGGAIDNSGSIEIERTARLSNGPVEFRGPGEARMTGFSSQLGSGSSSDNQPARILTNSAGHTISGRGTIALPGGLLVNRGTILADEGQIGIGADGFANRPAVSVLQEGLLRSEGAGGLRIALNQSRFRNAGRIEAFGAGGVELFFADYIENFPGAEIVAETTLDLYGGGLSSGDLRNHEGATLSGGGRIILPPRSTSTIPPAAL